MTYIKEESLEWALKHLTRFYDSDFFPKLFEFDAIKSDWHSVKSYIMGLDLEKYIPKSPLIYLAQKTNGNFRVVHQLDPIDSLIYTALIFENSIQIEEFRIPERRDIACSYRIKPDINGSFFDSNTKGYPEFINKAKELSGKYPYILICDITDFYNQIYLHRICSVYNEAGTEAGAIVENFLKGLNTTISRGIPVGPAPSIVIAEAIMADIDKKILSYTGSFVRYVDDIYMFFEDEEDAVTMLQNLTKYLYSYHRLSLSSEKTKILTSVEFEANYLNDEEAEEQAFLMKKLEELAAERYDSIEELEFEELETPDKLKIRAKTYIELFRKSIDFEGLNLGLMRHILRQAGRYKIRNIIPVIFENFNKLLPVLREIVIYFDRVLNEQVVENYNEEFANLLTNKYLDLPYVNLWIFTLFQNKCFNAIALEIDYSKIHRIREQAFIALRKKDTTWLKDKKDGVDTLGYWDKRAILYTASILSDDEAKHWLGLESSKGDVVNTAICKKIIAEIKQK